MCVCVCVCVCVCCVLAACVCIFVCGCRFRWPVDYTLLETVYGGVLANYKEMGLVGDDESFNYWLEQCGECN